MIIADCLSHCKKTGIISSASQKQLRGELLILPCQIKGSSFSKQGDESIFADVYKSPGRDVLVGGRYLINQSISQSIEQSSKQSLIFFSHLVVFRKQNNVSYCGGGGINLCNSDFKSEFIRLQIRLEKLPSKFI